MSSRAAPRIAVLMGGPSVEREVSLVSGRECAAALRGEGYDVVEMDAQGDLCARLRDSRADIVFNALHGRWGEDGCVQGLLEWLGLPYTHSGVLASALAMDKERSKLAFRAEGLPVAESRLVARDALHHHPLPPPYVLKPVNEGSSVGVHFVFEGANAPPRLSAEAGLPGVMMAEAYVPGRELTVTVLGDRALTVTDIVSDGWYDYDAKYRPGGSRHILPADLPETIFAACLSHALAAHRVLGCRGMSRADFRWNEALGEEGLILLEVNTQPGMTPTSLSPEQAAHCGIGFGALCRWLVEDASCDR
ncbi:MAG: D-alanine--D-alanine ligase [Rhodobacteraceae bacterium]|nr:D-alanine--D-alanine ligase [Paracoccaceae bacterium]